MEQLWAPWRLAFILKKKEGCIFCQKPQEGKDEENFILLRGEKNFIILNTYPYNPGHLMVAPYRHIANPEDLTPQEIEEHFQLVFRMIKALKSAFNPQGFNIGMNLGKGSGAGIVDHLHTHIVPRWEGDTNFMPIIANTKVIAESLTSVYERLKDVLSKSYPLG